MMQVGFSDKLRLLTVLMDDLKLIKEIAIKGCKDVAFSNGGQFFAAVNGVTVSLYNAYTCENVGNLRGHNGKVRADGAHTAGLGGVCLYTPLTHHALHSTYIASMSCDHI